MTSTDFAPLPPGSPLRRFFLPMLALSLGALYLVSRHPLSPGLLTALSGLMGLAYLPGLAAALWIERRFGLWASWILPLVLSPVVSTILVLLLAFVGISPEVSPSWIVLASVAAIAFAPQPGHELEDVTVSAGAPGILRSRTDLHQVILIATFVLGLIAVLLLARGWIPLTGSAAFELAVSRALSVSIPPQDPLLAGLQLSQAWAFPLYLGVLESVTRVTGGTLLIGGSLIAAFTLVFTAYRALTLAVLGHGRALWGLAFLLLGLGGSFWITQPLLASVSMQTAGGDMLRLSPGHRALFPHEGTFFLEWLLRPGPHSLGLVYFLLVGLAGPITVSEPRLRWSAHLFLGVLGLALFYPAMAVVPFLVTVLLVPAALLVLGVLPWSAPGRRILVMALVWLAALALAWPYLRTLGAPPPYTDFLDVSWPRTRMLLDTVGLELLFAAGPLIWLLASREPRRQILAVWGVLFMAIILGVGGMPSRFDTVSPLQLHMVLALLAGSGAAWLWARTPRAALPVLVVLLGLILVPRTGLGLASYWSAEDPRGEAVREATAWIRRETPPQAVLVDTNWDLSLATGRGLVFPGDAVSGRYLNTSGHTVRVRATAHYSLLRGEELSAAEYENLLAIGAPVYVIQHMGNPSPHTGTTLPVHQTPSCSIFVWEPSTRPRTP